MITGSAYLHFYLSTSHYKVLFLKLYIQMDGKYAADFTFKLTRAPLCLLGLWPNPKKSSGFFPNLLTWVIVSMIFVFGCFPQHIKLVMVWGDLDKTAKVLSLTSIPQTLSMFKMIHLWAAKEKLMPLITCIEQDWTNSKAENERELMTNFAKKCRKVSLVCVIVSQSTFIVYTIKQISVAIIEGRSDLTNTTRTTYVEAYFPYDINKSPNFQLSWLLQCMSIEFAMIAYVGIDSLFGILVLHICGQFRILRKRILECVEKTDGEFCKWKFREKVFLIVQRHEQLNNCIVIVEDTFNIMFLVQMIGFTVLFCLQSYVLILAITKDHAGSDPLELLSMIIYIQYIVLTFYGYCYIGDYFRRESTGIASAAYSCKWYNLRAEEAIFIIFLTHRARKTEGITAGKFCVFSLELFTSVMRTSLGYLSMLLAVKKRNVN